MIWDDYFKDYRQGWILWFDRGGRAVLGNVLFSMDIAAE
jgi:hypothetical protein